MFSSKKFSLFRFFCYIFESQKIKKISKSVKFIRIFLSDPDDLIGSGRFDWIRVRNTAADLMLCCRDELACGSAYSARVFLAGPPESTVQLHYYVMTQASIQSLFSELTPLIGTGTVPVMYAFSYFDARVKLTLPSCLTPF